MFQVRLVSPRAETADLLDQLAADAGVSNVAFTPGARSPDGDAIQFDLQASAAARTLRRLRERGIGTDGPVAVQVVDATIGDPEYRPGWRHRPHLGEAAPPWDLVAARIQAEASYAPSFFMLLAIAGLIAACGILTNSQILIVAAMVVGPEYNAIISVAHGIDTRDWTAVRTGLIALGVGFAIAIGLTFVFALCIDGLGKTPQAYQLGLRPVSALINSPNLFSVVVATLAGVVGVVSLAESRANALIGVFISITTIPAAADVGVSLAYRSWSEAGGSAEQLLLNVGLLIIVGALALRLLRWTWRSAPGS
jgi:uncharacterized hydrophobic protein (TIGR00271 family)